MSNAGAEKITEFLESLQAKEDRALHFLKTGLSEDRLQHIRNLTFQTKGAVNAVFRSKNGIRNYPCITKIFEPVSCAKGSFPKETTRDPVTCAKVLYVLCNNYPDKSMIEDVKNKAFQCKAQCDLCYRLAFEEYYRHGILRCKK